MFVLSLFFRNTFVIRTCGIFCKCILFCVNKNIALSRILAKCMPLHKSCRASCDVNVNCILRTRIKIFSFTVREVTFTLYEEILVLFISVLISVSVYHKIFNFSINLHIQITGILLRKFAVLQTLL